MLIIAPLSWRGSTCNSEVHFQRAGGAGISASPTLCNRPERLLLLVTVVTHSIANIRNVQAIKNP